MNGDSVPPPPEKRLKPADLVQNSWIEYYSHSYAAWLPAVITSVNPESGEVQLNIRSAPNTVHEVQQLMRRRTVPTADKLDWLRRCIQNQELDIEGRKIFNRFALHDRSAGVSYLHSSSLREISFHCNNLLGVAGMISLIKNDCFTLQQTATLNAWLTCFRKHATHVHGLYGDALIAHRAPCRREDPRRNYDFRQELGKGTYGVVVFAVDSHGNQRAVKEVRKDLLAWLPCFGSPEENTEIENLVAMDHPHIVKLYEWYDHLSSIYLVMDFCNGGELGKEIDKRKRFRPVQRFTELYICDVMKQILSAIAYMHGRGLMHLDIKCDNIMLSSSRRTAAPAQGAVDLTLAPAHERPHVMVIDLGVGLFVQPGNLNAGNREPRGTPYTMAPEIWSLEFTTAADVFSLGVVFFCLMSFGIPYPDVPCTTMQAAVAWWSRKPEAPWQVLGPYSDNAVQLCKAMLNHSRQQRPSASHCLQSAFIRQAPVEDGDRTHFSSRMQTKIEQIRKLPRRSLLYRSIALAIAQNWPSNQFPSVKRLFDRMDTEGNGQLNTTRIVTVLKEYGITEMEANTCASAMALSRRGFVHWSEFMAACIDLGDMTLEQDLRNVFNRADTDADGRLSQKDVGTLLAGQHLQGQVLRDIFRDVSGSSDPNVLVDWPMFRSHFLTPIRNRLPAVPGLANGTAAPEQEVNFFDELRDFFEATEEKVKLVVAGVQFQMEEFVPQVLQEPLNNFGQTPAGGQHQAPVRGQQAPPPPRGLPGARPLPGTPRQAPGTPRAAPSLVQDLMAMGFSKEQAEQAARRCSSVEAAVEWISTNI